MHQRHKLAFIALILAVFLTQPIPVQGSVRQREIWNSLNIFAPCLIQVEYATAKNVTVSDVQVHGPSLYEVTQTPSTFQFEAFDIDGYSLSLTLDYDVITTQSISISIFSGNQPPNIIQVPIEADEVSLHFDITAGKEPVYPSPMEITNSVMSQMRTDLNVFHEDNLRSIRSLKDNLNIVTVVVLVVGLGGASVIMVVRKMLDRLEGTT